MMYEKPELKIVDFLSLQKLAIIEEQSEDSSNPLSGKDEVGPRPPVAPNS